ncbi:MAG: hypothetical protein WCC98_16700 [Candidatus Acidiferrales bacterium]
MIREAFRTCSLLGIDAARLNPMELYEAAGRIAKDPLVTAKRNEILVSQKLNIFTTDALYVLLRRLSGEEKLAVRERVTGIVPMRKI